jgi:hypothetical protein
MRFEMVDPQRVILMEIADKRMTRDDVAMTYAFAIRQHGRTSDEFDYARVNRAIVERWSMAALVYVKERAWRLIGDGGP